MSSTIKNIILFLGIGIALVVLYFFIFKSGKKEEDFATSVDLGTGTTTTTFPETLPEEKAEIARAFLSDLLSIRNIGLNADVFSEVTFSSLRDAGVVLIQDGKEGRPNPFAPIGQDILVPENVVSTNPEPTPATTTTPETQTKTPTTNTPAKNTTSTTTPTTPKTGSSTN